MTSGGGCRIDVESVKSELVDVQALTRLSIDEILSCMKQHQNTVKPFLGDREKAML